VRAGWKQTTKRVERFGILANPVIPRRCVPRIENHAFRFERIQCRADVRLKFGVGQCQSEWRRFTHPNKILDLITIEFRKFQLQSVATVFSLHDHRPKLPMDHKPKPIALSCASDGELSSGETFPDTGFAPNHEDFAPHDVTLTDEKYVFVWDIISQFR